MTDDEKLKLLDIEEGRAWSVWGRLIGTEAVKIDRCIEIIERCQRNRTGLTPSGDSIKVEEASRSDKFGTLSQTRFTHD